MSNLFKLDHESISNFFDGQSSRHSGLVVIVDGSNLCLATGHRTAFINHFFQVAPKSCCNEQLNNTFWINFPP